MSDNNDQVSVDEMMKNLKREDKRNASPSEREQGVMVTRADGSRALKVKSRKRRSKQPGKERKRKNTRKKVLLICSGIFILLMLGVGFIITLAYYNGNKFSEKVRTTIASHTGAEVEMRGLNFSVKQAEIAKLSLDWTAEHSVADQLNLEGINAGYQVFSFFTKKWNGPEVLAETGELQLYAWDRYDEVKLGGELPVEFDFETYKCNKLNVTLGKENPWKVRKTQANFINTESGEKRIYLYGGSVEIDSIENYGIQSGVIDIEESHADISFKLKPDSGNGTLSLDGKVPYKKGTPLSFDATFSQLPLRDWMNIKARRLINGEITNGNGKMMMNLGDVASRQAVINAESTDIRLSIFLFIDTLTFEMKDTFYSAPKFRDRSKFKLEWRDDRVIFSELDLVENARMRLRGNMTIMDTGALSGTLNVGIPLLGLSRAEIIRLKRVFKEDDGDFLWTEIVLGGTVDIPTDNLAEQFAREKGSSIASPIPEDKSLQPLESGSRAEDLFNQLNQELSE